MFESRIIKTATQRGLVIDGKLADGLPDLRPLTWAEITARLAAARDLREALSGTLLQPKVASFDSAAAEMMAEISAEDSQFLSGINPDDLGAGKHSAGIAAAHPAEVQTGDRGSV